jgi:hypothetical protein
MYDVYKALLNRYKANNYTLNAPLMLFSSVGLPSKYGSWGLLDYMDQVAETPTHPSLGPWLILTWAFEQACDLHIKLCFISHGNIRAEIYNIKYSR